MPPKEDEHEIDTSHFTSWKLQTEDFRVCLLDSLLLQYLCHPPCLQEEGVWVEGSRGLCGSPQCPSSPWWWPTDMDHIEQKAPATLPASFSPAPQSCNWLHTSVVTTDFGLTVDSPYCSVCFNKSFVVLVTELKWK